MSFKQQQSIFENIYIYISFYFFSFFLFFKYFSNKLILDISCESSARRFYIMLHAAVFLHLTLLGTVAKPASDLIYTDVPHFDNPFSFDYQPKN